MKASIIICTFNEEKTIAEVLIACCNLNPDCEIIVVDDGSTDHTNGKETIESLQHDINTKLQNIKGKLNL